MKKYMPKSVPAPRVLPSIFGPIGRKWLDLHGLEGRFKIAPTSEGEAAFSKPKETKPKTTGQRMQGSEDAPRFQQPKREPPKLEKKPPVIGQLRTYKPRDEEPPLSQEELDEISKLPRSIPADWNPGQDEFGEFDFPDEGEAPTVESEKEAAEDLGYGVVVDLIDIDPAEYLSKEDYLHAVRKAIVELMKKREFPIHEGLSGNDVYLAAMRMAEAHYDAEANRRDRMRIGEEGDEFNLALDSELTPEEEAELTGESPEEEEEEDEE